VADSPKPSSQKRKQDAKAPPPVDFVPPGVKVSPGSKFTPEVAALIVSRIREGWSFMQLERSGDCAARSTILDWMHRYPEFDKACYEARRVYVSRMVYDLDAIADDGTNDFVERERTLKNGTVVKEVGPDLEHIARSRLRLDTRKWLLAKVYPKLYGDGGPGAVGDFDPNEKAAQFRECLKQMLALSDCEKPKLKPAESAETSGGTGNVGPP
jgi:hypothetical protein